MKQLLDRIIEENRYLTELGKVADYIPALSTANPDDIGVCYIDEKNNLYKSGAYNTKFTIQSISKILTLTLAIMDNGLDRVFEKVGVEGTDEPFNSFVKLDSPNVTKPANPMINAGAIVVTSLIKGDSSNRFQRILDFIRLVTDNDSIGYSEEVYLSEKTTGSRNRAMAYLMSNKGILDGDVEDILDTYFKQCSIEIDVVDLAKIGKFISEGCKGLELSDVSKKELTILLKGILLTSGMYDYSGRYAIEVGIPTKSGVSGGLMGVVPGNRGIGIYSPSLDIHGNSIAGLGIIKSLSKELNLNIFN
ncbi:MAG: glutaminase A [Tissierella sp.]|nr:glutaminase A [Tissierella sp.]